MAHPRARSQTTLQITRTFPAPRETVFRAWTVPEELTKWWGPQGYSTPSAQIDLRVGGTYRIAMRKDPDGDVFYLTGTYREIRPPEKLVYTWRWEAEPELGETTVTVEFGDLGTSTQVLLTHELFPTEKACEDHRRGWSSSFDRLAARCAAAG